MSNGHAGTNCAVVMGSNGIPFPLTKALNYINQFLFKNGTVAINRGTLFARTAAVLGSNGWGLVINSSCNGWRRKLQWKRVQRPFPFD